MNVRYLLGIALAAATAVAACGGGDTNTLGYGGDDPDTGGDTGGTGGNKNPTPSPSGSTGGNTTPTPTPETNSKQGQAFFVSTVHPMLSTACGGCHETGPGPGWIFKGDANKSYSLIFQLGYVSKTSRILQKGVHAGTAPALTADQSAKYNQWVDMELKDSGGKATPNVLEKLAGCLDATLYNAINYDTQVTTRRNNENANNCTGCNQAQCKTCHSGGDAFFAVKSQNTSANFAFEQTKLTNPAFIQKYFGVSPTGEPIASNAIKLKADATKTDKPYTHPMYTVNQAVQTQIDAFVNDAITKYKAGSCGK